MCPLNVTVSMIINLTLAKWIQSLNHFDNIKQNVQKKLLKNMNLTLYQKKPDYQHDAILTDALDPPSMFYTEWETPLTENDESSDNTKILQSVPTLPK